MMAVEQISVFVQNEKGALSHVLDALGAANIEIRALSIADTSDFGILRMITDNNKKAQETLKKENYICMYILSWKHTSQKVLIASK